MSFAEKVEELKQRFEEMRNDAHFLYGEYNELMAAAAHFEDMHLTHVYRWWNHALGQWKGFYSTEEIAREKRRYSSRQWVLIRVPLERLIPQAWDVIECLDQ